MLENIKAVLFDLDGTLVDSMWVWRQIDLDYLGKRHLQMPKSLQKDIEGMSMRETACFFQKQFGITDDIDTMMAEWNAMAMDAYANHVTWKPGAEAFLQDCAGMASPQALRPAIPRNCYRQSQMHWECRTILIIF